MTATPPLADTMAHRAVQRTMAGRQAGMAAEIQRVVEATYGLVEETGDVNPSMRQILAHTGLSSQGFYRLFRSKDELVLVVLDDGRRRLVTYLDRRMGRVRSPEGKVRAWVEGVMAQASDPRAARRTRPFVVSEARLAEEFPEEHRASVDNLVSLLVPPLSAMAPVPRPGTASEQAEVLRTAHAVYRVTFATLHDHLLGRRRPSAAIVEHLVGFVLRGAGGTV
jgi:AcrR family transcriptional regulator